MTKRISVWLTVVLIILTSVITFQLTVIFGSAFVRDNSLGSLSPNDRFGNTTTSDTVPTDTNVPEETTAPDDTPAEPKPVTAKDITAAVSAKISTLATYYERYYVGELDIDALVEGAAEGFVAYVGDKYGQYHTAEEYKELTSSYSGEFAGIGVSVVYNSDYGAIEILNVMPDSPALEGGLLPDDLIISVNGESVMAIGYNEAVNRIRGEIGTSVLLTIARGENYEEHFDVTLTRRKVEEQSVTYEEIPIKGLKQPVAYIRITDFNAKTPEQFSSALGEGKTNNVHGFIFDLRNNGGGTLDSVVTMRDMVLPEGPIVRIQYKNGEEKVYESRASCLDEPIVVLVNGNTASAAELFVSALRDYGKATPIIGETTYGKGTVQTIVPLIDGSALRLSTSMYAPPYSDNFEGIGVVPDMEVPLADEYKNVNLFKLDLENDAQLQAAVRVFQ